MSDKEDIVFSRKTLKKAPAKAGADERYIYYMYTIPFRKGKYLFCRPQPQDSP